MYANRAALQNGGSMPRQPVMYNLWLFALCAANALLGFVFKLYTGNSIAFAALAYAAFLALFLMNGIIGGRIANLALTIVYAALGFAVHLVAIAAIPFGPCADYGVGFAHCSVIFVAPLTAIGYFCGRYVRKMPEPGLCPKCRYDLRGNTSGTCPECGYRFL